MTGYYVNEYMNELITCNLCNRQVKRKNLYWNTCGSYTDTCQKCKDKGDEDILMSELYLFWKFTLVF